MTPRMRTGASGAISAKSLLYRHDAEYEQEH